MEVLLPTRDDPVDWNDDARLVRRHNLQRAKLIRRRLDDLAAVPTLDTMHLLPGRCHELKGDRDGQLSLDLDGPFRLLFKPTGQPLPRKPDGGLDWKQVNSITLLGVVDTHE